MIGHFNAFHFVSVASCVRKSRYRSRNWVDVEIRIFFNASIIVAGRKAIDISLEIVLVICRCIKRIAFHVVSSQELVVLLNRKL